jgi:hypothetical protein
MMTKTNGAGRAYLSQVKEETEEIEVTGGFRWLMKKRGPFSTVFNAARLPQVAASGAVESWTEKGLIKPGEVAEDQVSQLNYSMSIVDQVIELSVSPKLVLGEPANDNEVSVKNVKEQDLAILFTWAAGGKASDLLAKFSVGSGPDALASAGRKKQRPEAELAGGN